MKNIALAVAAMAFAPFALAAEGQDDADPSGDARQPTMLELKQSIDHAVRRLGTVEATLGTLSSTITANHTTIVGKFAQQVAVVTTVPTAATGPSNASYYLAGDSSIAGFPAGTVAADGRFTDRTLPAGTYLFELQQPYSDNVICQRSVSIHWQRTAMLSKRRNAVCPRLHLIPSPSGGFARLDNGFGIYTKTSPSGFTIVHKFPDGLTFTDDKPLNSYVGAVRITKLK